MDKALEDQIDIFAKQARNNKLPARSRENAKKYLKRIIKFVPKNELIGTIKKYKLKDLLSIKAAPKQSSKKVSQDTA